jgi:hypothetical protein
MEIIASDTTLAAKMETSLHQRQCFAVPVS